MTTAETFATVVAQAMTLDPFALTESLLIVHDRLPCSATGSESGIRAVRVETCQDPTCPQDDGWDHTHPVPTDPTGDAALRPSESDRDLDAIEHHVGRFVANVAELVARSHSRGVPTDWHEAVKLGHLLVEMGAVSTLEGSWGALAVKRWVAAARDAIHDLQLIADGHASREPSTVERHWTNEESDEQCCRIHLRCDPAIRERAVAHGLCRQCGRLKADAADVLGLDFADAPDPTTKLLEEFLASGNQNGGPRWRAARSRWLQGLERDQREIRA